MSLVLEALRRVERSTGGPGRAGHPLAFRGPLLSHRFARVWPLLCGMLVGGVLVAASADRGGMPPEAQRVRATLKPSSHGRGGAGLPPPPFETAPVSARAVAGAFPLTPARARRPPAALSPTPLPFVLLAISERDSRLMAVVNDQLVAEGDAIGDATVIRIEPDSVLLGWRDGRRETVRFAPLPSTEPSTEPPPEPTASPLPR